MRGHAIANGMYVAAVNRIGHEGTSTSGHRVLGPVVRQRSVRPDSQEGERGQGRDSDREVRPQTDGGRAAELALLPRPAHRCLRRHHIAIRDVKKTGPVRPGSSLNFAGNHPASRFRGGSTAHYFHPCCRRYLAAPAWEPVPRTASESAAAKSAGYRLWRRNRSWSRLRNRSRSWWLDHRCRLRDGIDWIPVSLRWRVARLGGRCRRRSRLDRINITLRRCIRNRVARLRRRDRGRLHGIRRIHFALRRYVRNRVARLRHGDRAGFTGFAGFTSPFGGVVGNGFPGFGAGAGLIGFTSPLGSGVPGFGVESGSRGSSVQQCPASD